MNLLFIIGKYPDYGGVEKLTTLFANRFTKDLHKVYIVSFEQNEKHLLSELDKRVDLIFLKKPVLKIGNIRQIRNLVVERKIDIIINQWCLPYYITIFSKLISFYTSAKCVFVYHNTPKTGNLIVRAEEKYNLESKSKILRYLNFSKLVLIKNIVGLNFRLGYYYSDRYVLYVEGFGKEFMAISRLSEISKMRYIPNPVTIDRGKYLYSMSLKKKQIVWVGRLEIYQKRIDRVINIWKDVEKKNADWSLLIVGDGPDREKLEKMVSDHHIARVSFEGFQDPKSYFENASVLLLTSDFEGFGLVIVEGMNFGVIPIVYNTYCAVDEIVSDEEDGYVIPPFDKVLFEDRLEGLMRDPMERDRMAKNALQKAECFSVDEIANMWYKLFDELKN